MYLDESKKHYSILFNILLIDIVAHTTNLIKTYICTNEYRAKHITTIRQDC